MTILLWSFSLLLFTWYKNESKRFSYPPCEDRPLTSLLIQRIRVMLRINIYTPLGAGFWKKKLSAICLLQYYLFMFACLFIELHANLWKIFDLFVCLIFGGGAIFLLVCCQNQAEAHYKGHKHARKLKAIDKLKNKQRILGKSVWRERERKKPMEGEMEDGSLLERTGVCKQTKHTWAWE